ncbi:MAG: hypothetical protein WCS20_12350 [Alphaproteobacteria bacterium]|jgi:hypothetical protein
MSLLRALLLMAGLGLLTACETNDLKEPRPPLGDFVLGLNIAVADQAQAPGISRQAKPEEWKAGIEKAMTDRFGRYEGSRIYNFSIRVDGYVLAPPGLPIVASPRSALIATVYVFEDATQTLLNPEGKQLTMVEGVSPETFLGSGLTQNKSKQIERMSYRMALAVQNYLLENPGWFGLPPEGSPELAAAVPGAVAPMDAPVTTAPVTPEVTPPGGRSVTDPVSDPAANSVTPVPAN